MENEKNTTRRNIVEIGKTISQIETYDLKYLFKNQNEIIDWVNTLNELEFNNFASLDIPYQEIKFNTYNLLNKALLNSIGYSEKIKLIASIHNVNERYDLLDYIFQDKILNSPNFYDGIEFIKIFPDARRILTYIGTGEFNFNDYDENNYKKLIKR